MNPVVLSASSSPSSSSLAPPRISPTSIGSHSPFFPPNTTCLVAALWHSQGLKGHPWPWKQRSADPSPPQGPSAAVSVASHNLTKRIKHTQLSWNSGRSKNVNFSEYFEEFFLSKDSRTSEQWCPQDVRGAGADWRGHQWHVMGHHQV